MTELQQSRAFLGFGGNLGDPLHAFRQALGAFVDHPQVRVISQSPLYRTPAVGGPNGQPDYLNAVLEIRTSLPATELLQLCQRLEQAAGRAREVRWGARTLDIDLLFFAEQVLDTLELTLPHPRLHQRHFVLLPLAELAPNLEHPRLHKTVRQLLAELPKADGITQLNQLWTNND